MLSWIFRRQATALAMVLFGFWLDSPCDWQGLFAFAPHSADDSAAPGVQTVNNVLDIRRGDRQVPAMGKAKHNN
jgi:hypothetical protein